MLCSVYDRNSNIKYQSKYLDGKRTLNTLFNIHVFENNIFFHLLQCFYKIKWMFFYSSYEVYTCNSFQETCYNLVLQIKFTYNTYLINYFMSCLKQCPMNRKDFHMPLVELRKHDYWRPIHYCIKLQLTLLHQMPGNKILGYFLFVLCLLYLCQ